MKLVPTSGILRRIAAVSECSFSRRGLKFRERSALPRHHSQE